MTDFTKMSAGDMLSAVGDDARKWAEAFVQTISANPEIKIDESLMLAWFASAIEHSSDVRHWRKLKAEHEALVDFLEKERERKRIV